MVTSLEALMNSITEQARQDSSSAYLRVIALNRVDNDCRSNDGKPVRDAILWSDSQASE